MQRFSAVPRKQLQHFRYLGSTDDQGYPTGDDYGPAVVRAAFAIAPEASRLDQSGSFDRRVVTSLVVAVPDVTPFKPRDKVIVPGVEPVEERTYFVSEDVRDYTDGPFDFAPGGDITIEKVS